MKAYMVLGLALALAGCGEGSDTTKADDAGMAGMPASEAAAPAAADATYSATGKVTAISGTTVTIAHGPVEGLGWPAMTMGFEAADPATAQGVKVGDEVTFSFKKAGDTYQLTQIAPAAQ